MSLDTGPGGGHESWAPDPQALRGRVAVVAGATRGAGRGIAAALGEAGATVICTGRSSRTRALRSDYERPETIEETAELVTRLGGTGIAEAVDHLDAAQVKALAERIQKDQGRLDVLVNDIWGGEVLRAARRSGTRRSGSSTSTPGSASSGSPSRRIS
jgi:NAD(P)-dependent dehydrogenase (short-subunit alcohol dehydrogenase family)